MKRFVFPSLALLMCAGEAISEAQGNSLPVWTDEDRELIDKGERFELGGLLWPGAQFRVTTPEKMEVAQEAKGGDQEESEAGDETEPKEKKRAEIERMEPGNLALDPSELELARLMSEGGNGEAKERDLFTRDQLKWALDEGPEAYLVDPQNLVEPRVARSVSRFLESHARESPYDLYVLILDPSQQGGDQAEPALLREQWFGEGREVVVVYYLGRPSAAEVIWCPEQLRALEPDRCVAIWQSSVDHALEAQGASVGLERFVTELSLQLFWVARDLHAGRPPDTAAEEEAPALAVEAPVETARAEQGMAVTAPAVRWGLAGSGVLGLLGGAAWGVWRTKKRWRVRKVYFPAVQVQPRLGAPYSGGGHPVMSFGSEDGE